jgi:cell division protein FtsB
MLKVVLYLVRRKQQQQQLVTEAQIATLTASVDYLSHRIEQLAASVEALRQELKDDNNNFIFIITTSYPLRFYAGSSQSILALLSWCIV